MVWVSYTSFFSIPITSKSNLTFNNSVIKSLSVTLTNYSRARLTASPSARIKRDRSLARSLGEFPRREKESASGRVGRRERDIPRIREFSMTGNPLFRSVVALRAVALR